MNRKIVGAILLSAAGVVLTLGTVGAQIDYAVAQAGFYAGKIGGPVPPGPEGAHAHLLVFVATLVLGITGGFFLVGREKD